MSGLESIALAVAHLEEQQQQHQKEITDSSCGGQKMKSISAPPAPQSFGCSKTARVVSSDSIASYNDDISHKNESSLSLSPTNKRFDSILSDPSAWLHSQDQFTPLAPPPPSEVIAQILQDDVLCGRGGETNHHQGNIQYRNLVKAFQPLYIASKRRDKPRIAQCIVYTVRQRGGRFLKRTDPRSNTWVDVGNTKAREKTSQALREGAPELRGNEKPARVDSPSSLTTTSTSLPITYAVSPIMMPPPATTSAHTPQPPVPHLHHHAAPVPVAALTSLQQAMSRTLMTPSTIPVAIPNARLFHNSRKRPSFIVATVSDGDVSDASHGSNIPTTDIPRGPRLKRLKLRLEMEETI
jgi:hypothetical protein